MVLQAYFEFLLFDVRFAQKIVACANRVKLANEFQNTFHGNDTRIWSEVLAMLGNVFTCINDSWESFLQYADVGECFVILEQDVILRLILFDKIVFQQQRIKFGIRENILNAPDLWSELKRFTIYASILIEIAWDSFSNALRFSDIDKFTLRIWELVNTRGIGQILNDVGKSILHS